MLMRCGLALICLAMPASAAPGVCVTNCTQTAGFFVAEARGAPQVAGILAPKPTLCSGAGTEPGGVVRVFANADAIEGCSRLVPEGQIETLLEYVDFGRCHWSSHGN